MGIAYPRARGKRLWNLGANSPPDSLTRTPPGTTNCRSRLREARGKDSLLYVVSRKLRGYNPTKERQLMTENLLVLAAVVLLPLVPACILYRFLPSNTIVNGPFQGLNLQLTGAFGGYFLVLLAAFGFYHTLPDNHQPETEEIWTLRGKVPALVTNSNDLQLSVRPASTQIDEDGT